MVFLSILVVALALSTQHLSATMQWASHYQTLKVYDGGRLGSWGKWEMCPRFTFAGGFSLRVQRSQGRGDDTAVNGIRLYCKYGRHVVGTVTSAYGPWGVWKPVESAYASRLTRFQLKVQHPRHNLVDQTAVTSVGFGTSSYTDRSRYGMPWGTWGRRWSECGRGGAICGIQTRVQRPQGRGDDTALNDVRFACCRIWFLPQPNLFNYLF